MKTSGLNISIVLKFEKDYIVFCNFLIFFINFKEIEKAGIPRFNVFFLDPLNPGDPGFVSSSICNYLKKNKQIGLYFNLMQYFS